MRHCVNLVNGIGWCNDTLLLCSSPNLLLDWRPVCRRQVLDNGMLGTERGACLMQLLARKQLLARNG